MAINDFWPAWDVCSANIERSPTLEALRQTVARRVEDINIIRHFRFNFWGSVAGRQEPDWSISTFPADWPRQGPPYPAPYRDELLRRVWSGILPLDWLEAAPVGTREIVLPAIGVTVPVRGIRGSHGLACVAFNVRPEDWQEQRSTRMARAMIVALELQNRLEELYWNERRDMTLTTREIECVSLAARGKRSKEIAWELSLGEKTVNFHLSRARLKLRASNTTEAVMRAAELGLLNSVRSLRAAVA